MTYRGRHTFLHPIRLQPVEVEMAGGATRLVAVETGLFADGSVEISGSGLAAGMLVVVP